MCVSEELRALGYRKQDYGETPTALTPERASAIVANRIRRPERDLPRHWTRAGERSGSLGSGLLPQGLGGVVVALGAIAAFCASEPSCLRKVTRVARQVQKVVQEVLRGL